MGMKEAPSCHANSLDIVGTDQFRALAGIQVRQLRREFEGKMAREFKLIFLLGKKAEFFLI
jgi:hypothetical protein